MLCAWRTMQRCWTPSCPPMPIWTVRMPWSTCSLSRWRRHTRLRWRLSASSHAWPTWKHPLSLRRKAIALPTARARAWRPTFGSSTSASPSSENETLKRTNWWRKRGRRSGVCSDETGSNWDFLSIVMLFNAKIGKHNYSFSLKHKFIVQTERSRLSVSLFSSFSNFSLISRFQSFIVTTPRL